MAIRLAAPGSPSCELGRAVAAALICFYNLASDGSREDFQRRSHGDTGGPDYFASSTVDSPYKNIVYKNNYSIRIWVFGPD
jgi:hypothetical protein